MLVLGCTGQADDHPEGVGDPTGDIPVGEGGVAPVDLCQTPHEGCPCSTAGEAADCGKIVQKFTDYVTCSQGHITCDGNTWSACVGNRRTAMSVSATTPGGRRTQSASGPCDVCDPYCNGQVDNPSVVDAGGIAVTDAGVTLTAGDAAPSNTRCTGLQCRVQACGAGPSTTISGTVYDPAGKNPLYNAYVYIPVRATSALPAFSDGVGCDQCAGAGNLGAVAVAQTGPDGKFTLKDVPTGANIPVVVQLGKWRRAVVLSNVTACQDNQVAGNCTSSNPADCQFRLPRKRTDGYDLVTGGYTKADIPRMAMVTGSADPFECMLLKAGIDPTEFGTITDSPDSRIHFFTSKDAPGTYLDPIYGSVVWANVLWDSMATMLTYDVIVLACEGKAIDKKTLTTNPYANLIQYANQGGRAFITHYGYVWLEYPGAKSYVSAPDNWSSVASWTHLTGTTNTPDPMSATINTSFPKGAAFSQWMSMVNATSAANTMTVHEGRQDLTTVGASAQSWMNATDKNYTPGAYSPEFTFNAPYGADPSLQCGRVVYSDFHVSANALVSATSTPCLADSDCGFTAKCQGAVVKSGTCNEPCLAASDCPSGNYTCSNAAVGTCQPKTCSF